MNLLVQKNNYDNFKYDYSSSIYDIKFYIYLKTQYKNMNLNHICIHKAGEDFTFFVNDLCIDFSTSKKKYFERTKKYQKVDNMYVINDNFLDISKMNDERFHMFYLAITDDEEECGHANLLIYDKNNNTVYRFEPNGRTHYPELNDFLSEYFSKYDVKYSLLDGFYDKNINYGPQDYANVIERTMNTGTCMYWSYSICNLIQENYNNKYLDEKMLLSDFIQDFYDELYEERFSCSGFINNFIYNIKDIDVQKLIDPLEDNEGINWERICFLELSEEYVKKILKKYWIFWDTIVENQKLSDEFIKENDVYDW